MADAVWRTVEAPRFSPGFIFAAVTGMCMVLLSIGLHLLQLRYKDQGKRSTWLARVNVKAPVDIEKHES